MADLVRLARDLGNGTPVVWLHGFLENSTMWETFVDANFSSNRHLFFDYSGHGISTFEAPFSISEIAQSLKVNLDQLGIDRATLVGHSMGGYVALAFAELFPESLSGLCLFHSTAKADSAEKKANRTRAIEVVNEMKSTFIKLAIPNLFPAENADKYEAEIRQLIAEANKISEKTIEANLVAMRERPDRQAAVAALSCPVLWIVGKLDQAVPFASVEGQLNLAANSHRLVLATTGHMGHIEARTQCQQAIHAFLMA